MIVTKEHAKEKICHCKLRTDARTISTFAQHYNGLNCEADECMAWVEVKTDSEFNEFGCCGLVEGGHDESND